MNTAQMDIPEINQALEERLTALKSAQKVTEEVRTTVSELNDILYSMIKHHAPKVNAVQIEIRADDVETNYRCRDLPRSGGNREVWEKYVQMVRGTEETLERASPFLFRSHLPYSFTTGTHGSGERSARGNSFEKMHFKQEGEEKLGGGRFVPAVFELDISTGHYLSFVHCLFRSREVESIRMVQVADSEFSPIFDKYEGKLSPPHSALHHYLLYRGFGAYQINKGRIPGFTDEKLKTTLADLAEEHILIPEYETRLLTVGEDNTLTGFAAFESPDGEMTLFGFSSQELPPVFHNLAFSGSQAFAAAYGISLYQMGGRNHIKAYQGNDAIARLHEVKGERRF